MERNADSPIASSDAEAALGGAGPDTPGSAGQATTPGINLPPGPVVEERSRGGMLWLFIALVVAAVLIYLAKGMM